MRQGNGSDLLGANDPRSATIGVIYVAPNDDRESVLAAILTQEKLGRKQIAIALPGQNKAFQRPVDFEGLKNMRRKLQAQLIIVAPQGSSPAEFARQRRFTFFSSLESYGKSLRDESEATRSSKRGWLGGRRTPRPSAGTGANGNEMVAPVPMGVQQNALPPDDEEQKFYENHPEPPNNIVPLVAGMGAAGFVAGHDEMHHPEDNDTIEPLYAHQHNNSNDEDDVEFAPPSDNNTFQHEEVSMVPPPPLPMPIDTMDEDTDPVEDDMPGENDDENAPAAVPVPMPMVAPIPDDEPEDTGVVSPLPWRQSSAKRNVVGVPYQAGNAGTVGRGVRSATVVPAAIGYTGTGGGTTGTGGTSGSGRRRSGWQILLLALIGLLLLSLLLCGGIALAAPGTLGSALGTIQNFGSNVVSSGTPTATVTITPKSALLSNTYVITGISTGTPDPSKRQVQARQLTFTTKAQSKTVSATGQKKTPGTYATGTITFYNSSAAYYVAANTVFTDSQGRQMANDALVYIPAGNPASGTYGHATATAHAIAIGASGNLPAGDITNFPCCGDAAVGVSTTSAFTGGQDPQNYTVVQQGDVDTAANLLQQPAQLSAQTSLNGLKHANELFVNKPQCTNNVSSNPNVGDKATSVTVSVTATCTGQVYDQVGAEMIAANLLTREAGKDAGANYALSGSVLSSIISVTANSTGPLSVLAKAQGVWVYQFDATAKTNLAKLIVGKAENDATTLLLLQAGVSKVDGISIASGGNTLPTDFNQITIVVQPVSGLQGTPTVGAGSPTPVATVTPTTVQPTITVTVQGS